MIPGGRSTWDVHFGTARVLSARYPSDMPLQIANLPLQSIKMTFAAVWVFLALAIGLLAGVSSTGGTLALAAFGLLPPLALLLLWNDPPKSMSDNIRDARR